MAVFQIVKVGDPVLAQKAVAVKNVNENLQKLLDNMADTMYAANGVGLAAPQIGISKRVIVVDVGEGLVELINPEIVKQEGSEVDSEGCLSVPGVVGEVERAAKVWVKGLDREGKEVTYEADGLFARCLQHEIDHLEGTLFVDKAQRIEEVR